MELIKALARTVVIAGAGCVLGVGCSESALRQNTENRFQATETLRRYLELRRTDGDWKIYSHLITWPDEPAWDCKWVITSYAIGEPRQEGNMVVIPVTSKRLGLFCYCPGSFDPGLKTITIEYELKRTRVNGRWKIDGPDIDYPEIGVDAALEALRKAAESTEYVGGAERAKAAIRSLSDSVKRER